MTLLQAVEPVKAVSDLAKASQDYGHENVLIATIVVTVLLLVAAAVLTMKKSQDRFDKLQEAVIHQLRHGNDDNGDGTVSNVPSLQSLSVAIAKMAHNAEAAEAQLALRLDRQEEVTTQLGVDVASLKVEVDTVRTSQEEMMSGGCAFRAQHEPLIREVLEKAGGHAGPIPEAT